MNHSDFLKRASLSRAGISSVKFVNICLINSGLHQLVLLLGCLHE